MAQQPARFFTQSTAYGLPGQTFLIPTTWKRYQLSQLVNKALELAQPVPFDFLIRGSILLRGSSLGEWCTQHGVGEEETLDIEYIESVLPPQKISDIPQQDWLSAVELHPRAILTSSYDGAIRFFDYSKSLLSTTQVHDAPISDACLVSVSELDDAYTVASASYDLTARITQVSSSSSKILASLHLHTAPLSSIHSSNNLILTSSWDGHIGLWSADIPDQDELPLPNSSNDTRRKRRRVEEEEQQQQQRPRIKAPLAVLKSHTSRVSKAIFDPSSSTTTKAYSCALDSTVRIWDTERGICDRTITASEKPFLGLAVGSSLGVLLATSTDRTLTVYDSRSSSSSSASSSGAFIHPSTPSCIVVPTSPSHSDPTNPPPSHHQVLTGAYDGTVRVWDLRSAKDPVATFKVWDGNNNKILSVDWRGNLVAVGGEPGLELWKVGQQQ